MWTTALVLYQLWALARPLPTQSDAAVVTPQNCSLECVRQGGAKCEYCRITKDDVRKTLGFNSIGAFGGCVPWPCLAMLGGEDPKICQHYVQAPSDVKVEFLDEPNPKSDTIVVSWKPSYYGIAFLRGFQVSLQALGGSGTSCQLFLFHRNLSLSASQAQTVYKSDPFPGLSLDSQYAVTVMALPVPEEWEKFYKSKIFSTRSCAEKNGLEQCKQDWYPQHVEVRQEGSAVKVTFNLAPPDLGIKSYFSLCYANGKKKYTDITPNSSNKTHHTYQLHDLQEETNYTCEIAANEVDAVRNMFRVRLKGIQKDRGPSSPSLAVVLPLCLGALVMLGVSLAVLTCRRPKLRHKKLEIKPAPADMMWQPEEDVASPPPGRRLAPPRLLICYSSGDGAGHVKAVLQFAAFVQQHMATQVLLDLWDSLSVAEEGSLAWHCRQIRASDFVLVICSPALQLRPEAPEPERSDEDDEEEPDLSSNASASRVVIQVIGEEVVRAKAQGRDLSKYLAAIFEYSEETDIPTELRLVSCYTLTRDLALLFSHLHGVALHRPGGYLKIDHISDEDFAVVPAGCALQQAIRDAGAIVRAKRHHAIKEVD